MLIGGSAAHQSDDFIPGKTPATQQVAWPVIRLAAQRVIEKRTND